MAIPARISIVTLGVQDLGRAAAFYEALGWQRSSASLPDEIIWFKTAGTVLGLFPHELLAEDASLPAETATTPFKGSTLAINVETADEVQPALDEAARAGGKILKPATKADWGGVSGYFADPDGHAWEIAWNPGFPIRPDGLLDMP